MRFRRPETRRGPWLTCAEVADYLRFRGASGVRTLVYHGHLHADFRGPRGTLMFMPATLDRFTRERAAKWRCRAGQSTPPPTGMDRASVDVTKAAPRRNGGAGRILPPVPDEEPWEAEALRRKLVVLKRKTAGKRWRWAVFDAGDGPTGKRR